MVGTGEKIAMDCFGEALNLAAPPAARGTRPAPSGGARGLGPPGCALVTFFSDFFFKICDCKMYYSEICDCDCYVII